MYLVKHQMNALLEKWTQRLRNFWPLLGEEDNAKGEELSCIRCDEFDAKLINMSWSADATSL